MPTRIISWQQVVTEADPGFFYNRLHPLQYEFSSGRLFYASGLAPYTAYLPLTSDDGTPLVGNNLNVLETDHIPTEALMPGAALVHK